MMPIVRIGPATIQTSSLALIIALWICAFIAEREARRRGLRGDEVWNVLAIWVGVTIIAGRLIYVAQYLEVYANDWSEVFSLSPNTLATEYGVLCGLIVVCIYVASKKIPFARFADAVAVGVLVAIAIIAFGQFLSGDAYGIETGVSWAIPAWGAYRHPVQLYEFALVLVGLGILFWIPRKPQRDGAIALVTIAWYSATRLFVDGFRADAALLPNGYRVTQVVALIVWLLALWGMMRMTTKDERRMTND